PPAWADGRCAAAAPGSRAVRSCQRGPRGSFIFSMTWTKGSALHCTGYRNIVAIVARSQDSGLSVNDKGQPHGPQIADAWAMTVDAVYLVQLTLNGIALGLLYALIAVGLSLIFGVMEIINFAHGELLMLGAFAMAFVLPVSGLLYWPALAAAIIAVMLVGLAMYEVLLARLRPDEFERSILITLGLSIILIHLMQYLFTATPRLVDTQYGFEGVDIGT